MNKNYRLGIDLGASSLGWFALELDRKGQPCGLLGAGSRIFSDGREPKSHTPLSVEKRMAHGMSVRRDRLLQRKRKLMYEMKRIGLMPSDEVACKELTALNPYALRFKGVKEKMELHEIARAFFHINQRRGFKSNRRADRFSDENEKSAMKNSIKTLQAHLNGKTLGEYLYVRQKDKSGTRMRARTIKGKNEYEMYADRDMYIDEFNRIWDYQAQFYKNILNSENKQKIYGAIFDQRPLKIPERAMCRFEALKKRAYAAYPVSQEFRILQEVNNLEVVKMASSEFPLSDNARRHLANELLDPYSKRRDKNGLMVWSKIVKFLDLPSTTVFNLESNVRKGLQCDLTAKQLARKDCFGDAWLLADNELRERTIDLFFSSDDEKEIALFLKENYKISDEVIANILALSIKLPSGTSSLSALAMSKIIPHMREGMMYDKACVAAGYNFNAYGNDEKLDMLPYYGKVLKGGVLGGNPQNADEAKEPEKFYGKINNPTVHIALNQLRRVVNKLIEAYGKPKEIVIELARDLPLGEKGLSEIKSTQAKNRKDNEAIDEILEECGELKNAKNRMKYKLWKDLNPDELKRCCPFCGKTIPPHELFTSSFEIEHLLPFSQTFDDSRSNKVISCISCNRDKRSRTPYDAFGQDSKRWGEIVARVVQMDRSRQWRFDPDAMKKFSEKNGDMIARMLNDTRYMSKVAREYLTCLMPAEKIATTVGQSTALLRGKWGLNSLLQNEGEDKKNREDHRHHVIDAFVLACVDKGLLQKISLCAKMCEDAGLEKILGDIGDPFAGYSRKDLKDMLDSIIVSHKPDRGNVVRAISENKTLGALHNQTAYGRIGGSDEDEKITLASRILLSSLKFKKDNIEQVADDKIRNDLLKIFEELESEGLGEKDWQSKLIKYAEKHGIRRIRIHIKNNVRNKLIGVKDKSGKVYKYMANAENYCMDIYLPSGKKEWAFEAVSMYDAHQNFANPRWKKNDAKAKLVMRIFKNDIIAYEDDAKTKYGRICILASHGQIGLVPLTLAKIEGNAPKKMPSGLQKLNARKIYIDEIGRIFDPRKAKYSE